MSEELSLEYPSGMDMLDFLYDEYNEMTPVMKAILLNDREMMLECLDLFPVIDNMDGCGNTALHYAAIFGLFECAVCLVNRGANKDLINMDHMTPLMTALLNRHYGLADILIDSGASRFYCTQDGRGPLSMIITMNDPGLVQMFMSDNVTPTQEEEDKEKALYAALCQAAKCGTPEAIPVLLEHGASFDYQRGDLDPPINISASRGDLEMLNEWIGYGAPLERFDREGLTPLMHAAKLGHIEMCFTLLNSGAKVNRISPNGGKTALSLAIKNNHHICAEFLWNYSLIHLDLNRKAANRNPNEKILSF